MNHGFVTLDEVFLAAGARAASLVPETSGYLALALGDAASRLSLGHDDRAVMLTTEGSVSLTRRGDAVHPRLAAGALRDVLARLLAVSAGKMPGLARAARPREESDRGIDAVVEEIEAALIPVNRAAARRALSRLARETLRAKEVGKLCAARPAEASAAPPPAPAGAQPAPSPLAAGAPPLPAPAPEMPAPLPLTSAMGERALSEPAAPLAPRTQALATPAEQEPDEEPVTDGSALVISAKAHTPLPASPDPALVLAVAEADPVISLREPIFIPWDDLPEIPSPEKIEPTPTILGMPPVMPIEPPPIDELDLTASTELDAVAVAPRSPTPSDIQTIPLPRARILPPEGSTAALPARADDIREQQGHGSSTAASLPTRADDLLARFGVACGDEASMREAAACLKKFAGIETASPPPVTPEARPRLDPLASRPPKAPTPERAIPGARGAADGRFDALELPAPERRRSRPIFGAFAALLLGAAAGVFALSRVRPDLLASITARLAVPSAVHEASESAPPASEAPAH